VKSLTIGLWCVLASVAQADRVIPEPPYVPSPQNIQLIVTANGKPANGIAVAFYRDEGGILYWTGSTDANGQLSPPKLAPGWYRAVAETGKRKATLRLDVQNKNNKHATFQMKLELPYPLNAAEDDPVAARIEDFRGIVFDQSGTVVPNAKIEVVRRDRADVGAIANLQSDEKGAFSVHLDEGTYAAVFRCFNFKTKVVVFEVTRKGEKELRTTLEIADAD
jgi:5-hydroxyisourate hydrolase-like protein (transthyretin family)